jgi:hypothetical protein
MLTTGAYGIGGLLSLDDAVNQLLIDTFVL